MMTKHFSITNIIVLAILGIYVNPTSILAQRAIPNNNLAYPVLITIPNRITGTAFYLQNNKHLYLVTAKHVLFTEPGSKLIRDKAICLSYPEDITIENPIVLVIDVNACDKQSLIEQHQNHDVATIQIGSIVHKADEKSFSIKFNEGVVRRNSSRTKASIVVADVNSTKVFDDVLISNDVFIFGYPTSIGIRNQPQFEYQRPLLRNGIIAGKNFKKETIILDCPIYGGNSGGPVIEVDRVGFAQRRYLLIGVLSQFVPYTETWENKANKLRNIELSNSGYSVVTPIDKVIELISQYYEVEHQGAVDAAACRECPADYDPPARLRSAPATMRIETDVPGAKQVCPRGHRSSAGH